MPVGVTTYGHASIMDLINRDRLVCSTLLDRPDIEQKLFLQRIHPHLPGLFEHRHGTGFFSQINMINSGRK